MCYSSLTVAAVCVLQEEQDKGKVVPKQEKESDSDSNSSQPKK